MKTALEILHSLSPTPRDLATHPYTAPEVRQIILDELLTVEDANTLRDYANQLEGPLPALQVAAGLRAGHTAMRICEEKICLALVEYIKATGFRPTEIRFQTADVTAMGDRVRRFAVGAVHLEIDTDVR